MMTHAEILSLLRFNFVLNNGSYMHKLTNGFVI
jgi:hypothetical protein